MIYPKKAIAITCAIAIFCAQMPVSAYAAATDYIASQQDNIIGNLYQSIDKGDLQGVENFSTKVKSMLGQSALSKSYKVNFDFTDNNGDTPLIRAARQGHGDIVDYLVKQGANPKIANRSGQTAISVAAANGHYAIVKSLAAKGVPVPLNISQKMAKIDINNKAVASSDADTSDTMMVLGITGGVVLAGAIAGVALANHGGGSSGGGGGGSSPSVPAPITNCVTTSGVHPSNCDPTSFVTTETSAQNGFLAMNTQYAWARGYDGRIYNRNSDGTLVDTNADGFVKVAVMDSGVDLTHPDLIDNIVAGSVTCNGTGCVAGGVDDFNHGTWVSGVIVGEKNSIGMTGIAPAAKEISIKISESADGSFTSTDEPDVAGIKYAVANNVKVINFSYGLDGSIFDIDTNTAISILNSTHAASTLAIQYQNLVSHHLIFVASAGNNSDSNPTFDAALPYYFQGAVAPVGLNQAVYDSINPGHLDFSKNWVAAVAVDTNNKLASFSQKCGVAKDWCLAAPGTAIYTTDRSGGYATVQGTSFAAPNITGAVAVMLGAFPQLTPERVLQILFNTATDLNINPTTGLVDHTLDGVDSVYGHGLVNLQKATDPSDTGWTLSVLSASTHQTNNVAFNTSALNLSPAFGSGLTGRGLSVMFLDSYGKNYAIPLSAISTSLQKREDDSTKLDRFGYGVFSNRYDISDNSHVSYTMGAQEDSLIPSAGYASANAGDDDVQLGNASYMTTIGDEKESVSLNFNYKTSVADVFGFAGLSDTDSTDLSATGVYKNPYLNFSHDAKSSIVSYNHTGEGLTAGAYQGTQKTDNAYEFDDSDTNIKGMFLQYSYKNEYGLVSLTGGVNIEDKTLLGSEVSGAFNLSGNNSTYFTGVGAKYNLSDNLSLMGNYNIGVTKVQAADSSLFTSIGDVVSDSFSLGAEYTGMAVKDDRFGLAVSQPLRVRNAPANLSLPSAINNDGSIVYRNNRVNLAATQQEVDFETYYGLELSEKSKLALSGVYAVNPENTDQNGNEGLLLLKYSRTLN